MRSMFVEMGAHLLKRVPSSGSIVLSIYECTLSHKA